MHHVLKAVVLTLALGLFWAWGTTLLQAQPTLSDRAAPDHCPPRCMVSITVPAAEEISAQVDIETLRTQPGQELTWQSDRPVLVVFPEQTPFVGPSGRPVYQFHVRGSQRLRIRADSDEICSPPGCKYMVVDLESDRRPPLDPYIIIER
ncbi:MAG: hypothetical protein ACXIUM_03130 [Wenzhouxiangella sp.]